MDAEQAYQRATEQIRSTFHSIMRTPRTAARCLLLRDLAALEGAVAELAAAAGVDVDAEGEKGVG